MKILSFHSVKGGTGKTTVSLLTAKLLSAEKKKVCFIDIDIDGPGIKFAIDLKIRKKKMNYINEYLIEIPAAKTKIDVADIIADYIDSECSFSVIPFYLKAIDSDKFLHQAMHESVDGHIKLRFESILKYLENQKFDYCIIDNSPGIVHLSKEIMKIVNNKNGQILFNSTNDRIHLFGAYDMIKNLQEKNFGDLEIKKNNLNLIINRINEEEKYNYANMTGIIGLLKSDPVINSDFNQDKKYIFNEATISNKNISFIIDMQDIALFNKITKDGIIANLKSDKKEFGDYINFIRKK